MTQKNRKGRNMYKNILFDLYGTLIDIRTNEDKPELWAHIALLYGYKGAVYTADELKSDYEKYVAECKEKVRKEYPRHKEIDIPVEEVFEKLFKAKDVKCTQADIKYIAAAFRSISTDMIKLYDGVTDLLESLKKAGKKVYLLSNAQSYFTMNEMNMLGITKYFDDIFISSDHRVSKPDPIYFEKLIDKHNLDKKETIMVGNDWISDMQGAAAAGIDGLYIHQKISSEITGELQAKWSIMDGDVTKMKQYLI